MLAFRPVVLTVAGSDCSGGAGIQADIKAIEACGGSAAAVVTAVTAQNARAFFDAAAVSPELVRKQLEAVLDDQEVAAVKSGMLASTEIVRELASALRRHRVPHFVCDPVLHSSGGLPLLDPDALDVLREELLPHASIVTPNVREAERLSGVAIGGADDAETAARRLLDLGAAAVLIKGGHRTDRPARDLLVTAKLTREFAGEWIDSTHTHGTGCRLASVIATGLARGDDLVRSIEAAKRFVTEGLRRQAREETS